MSITIEQAVKATHRGGYAAFISAGLTLLFLIIALFSNSSDGLIGIYNDPSIFFDVFIIGLCGFGMLRMSRTAATVVLAYWILARIYLWLETGQIVGLPVALVFLYFFARAVHGSFAFHNLKKLENPDYRPASKWTYWIGIPSGVLFAFIIGFGLITMTSVVPSTKVLEGFKIPSNERSTLLSLGIVDPEEQILYFYSDDFTSVANAGNILTDFRVIRYFTDESNELTIYELFLGEISAVRFDWRYKVTSLTTVFIA